MKRIILLIYILNNLFTQSLAGIDSLELEKPSRLSPECDICGCGVGNYYLGVMPQFARSFVGMRYRYQSYDSHLKSTSFFQTQESFQTTELWSRIYMTNKLQALVFIPYHFNEQKEFGKTKKLEGLGDISVLFNYNILQHTQADTTNQNWKQNLWIGGGVKLPTGKHEYDEIDLAQVANPNFQLGSGSLDFLVNLVYTIRYKQLGLNADANYKINTTNRDEYRFGNKLSGGANLFYIQKVWELGLMPSTGLYWEKAQQDKRNDADVDETGGTATFANIGMDIYYKMLSLGGNIQQPVNQNLADGQIKAKNRYLLHFTWIF